MLFTPVNDTSVIETNSSQPRPPTETNNIRIDAIIIDLTIILRLIGIVAVLLIGMTPVIFWPAKILSSPWSVALEHEVGGASTVVMYNIGREWGKNDAAFFQNWFRQEYGMSVNQCRPSFAFEAWWWPFTSQGWGNWEIEFEHQKNGFVFIDIFNSAVARSLGDVGKPVCYLYAGLFAGFFSILTQKSLDCIETQCYATGETYCKFLLGKEDRVKAATFWHTQGANAKDIEAKFLAGEHLEFGS